MRRVILGVVLGTAALSLSVFPEQLLESGTFFFQIEEDVGMEEFSYARLDEGNLKLTSDFRALSDQLVLDFGTDKLFTQEIILSPQLELISYVLDSDTERGKFHVEVKVEDAVATMSFRAEDPEGRVEQGERQVILEDNVITTGIAASQFFLMQQFLNEKLPLAEGEETTVIAFDPTDIDNPLVELTFTRLKDVMLEDSRTKRKIRAGRVEARQEAFRVELLACAEGLGEDPCTEKGRFLGFVSSTATLAGVKLEDAPGGGALVVEVAPGSFAAEAGLKAGDVITHVDGIEVQSAWELRNLIRFHDPAQPVTLTVQRDGQTLEIEVRLSGSRLLVFRSDLFPAGFAVLGEVP